MTGLSLDHWTRPLVWGHTIYLPTHSYALYCERPYVVNDPVQALPTMLLQLLWIHLLGPELSTLVTWYTLGRIGQRGGPYEGFGEMQTPDGDTSPRASMEGVARGMSLWLERHLWLDSDLNTRNSIKGNQKDNLFQVFWKDPRAQMCQG